MVRRNLRPFAIDLLDEDSGDIEDGISTMSFDREDIVDEGKDEESVDFEEDYPEEEILGGDAQVDTSDEEVEI